jgi:hypothetical protein
VTALGERILAELGEAATTNTLTRWLTHHVARLVDAADRARAARAPDTDARDAEARTAILELWQHRSAWPSGWPPSRAAAIVQLLEGLPDLEDPAWFRVSAVGRLQDLHHHVLALLADLVAASDDGVEEGWLRSFGDHLTPDEMTLLTRAVAAPRRLDAFLRPKEPASSQLWRRLREIAAGGDVEEGDGTRPDSEESASPGDEVERPPLHPLVQLADAYHDTVVGLVDRATRGSRSLDVDGG